MEMQGGELGIWGEKQGEQAGHSQKEVKGEQGLQFSHPWPVFELSNKKKKK